MPFAYKGRKINLIGHSYGGDTVAFIVIKLPNRIDKLITIDPASWIWPDFAKVRQNVEIWVNVNAVGNGISGGDIAAFSGRNWYNNPRGFAHEHIL